ncbi:transcriptional regulator, AbrB family [Rippkaea orientalis PCC 8801]|uniref:Transcriptional regulator, AbrB family n=1 Tax=Rippkaea orientalis (strain PCC 8801 / RF-1) TaxID=41431 RepID=B7K1R8_RIPO1|nr:AbrB/MazE/SpoVT family DNA-binding domain-containing protein [Rippkaea orientalis]ACK67610.1 transcriptional regulator, AbrB family [Rippkaea orientalis PCC 8801]
MQNQSAQSKCDNITVSKLTQKYQATIPRRIREVLDLHQGDSVIFELQDDKVILKKVLPMDWDYLNAVSATLTEWLSPEDEEAYGDL